MRGGGPPLECVKLQLKGNWTESVRDVDADCVRRDAADRSAVTGPLALERERSSLVLGPGLDRTCLVRPYFV